MAIITTNEFIFLGNIKILEDLTRLIIEHLPDEELTITLGK